MDGAAAVGAHAVLQLALGPEALAGGAVLALVGALVDVALFVHLLEDALDGGHVIVVGGADEAVVGNVHQLPQVLHAVLADDDPVHELLGRDAGGLGLLLDLLAVLVGAGEEHHVIALQALVAGDGVGGHGAVGVADVQIVRGVVNGGGDIKGLLFHALFSCYRCLCAQGSSVTTTPASPPSSPPSPPSPPVPGSSGTVGSFGSGSSLALSFSNFSGGHSISSSCL